jgi:pantothenate kinase type III
MAYGRCADTRRFIGGLILPASLMLRALEMGTAGLKAPTGEAVDFPTNTSDALMSGGAHAIAGAIERMQRRLQERTGQAPMLMMSGGAAVKWGLSRTALREGHLVFGACLRSQRPRQHPRRSACAGARAPPRYRM